MSGQVVSVRPVGLHTSSGQSCVTYSSASTGYESDPTLVKMLIGCWEATGSRAHVGHIPDNAAGMARSVWAASDVAEGCQLDIPASRARFGTVR